MKETQQKMSAAFISACFLVVAMLSAAAAEPPLNVVGEGLLSKPFTMNGPQGGRGMRYAGPVVYSNEKLPIIFFPPPPKDAKPGFGGLSLFGKNKSPKSIKYVPMPHHDLPVLIYTSDKMPPIHVVQPPKNEGSPEFAPLRDEFSRPPAGSLSSAYRGILPEATSARIVTSSHEIPSTSYGFPMKALGSLDLSSPFSSSGETILQQQQQQPEYSPGHGFEPIPFSPVYEHLSNKPRPLKKVPPHILYSGQSPIHVYNEPNMFVQAPKEVPLKTYADMPPKASVGPSKPSFFGPASINSFAAAHSHPHHRYHHRRPLTSSPYHSSIVRPSSFFPARENLIPSESAQNSVSTLPCQKDSLKAESNQAPVSSSSSSSSNDAGQSFGRPPTYSFAPPQSMFSFGPFSIEYGSPSEPFMSFSEPTGSLSSLYGTINNGGAKESSSSSTNSLNGIPGGTEDEGWQPGPPPTESTDGQQLEAAWDAPMPPPLASYQHQHHQHHHQQQHGLRPPTPYHGGRQNPMHSSVFLPSPHGTSLFGGSKLAHLLSAFKLKRSKPKYAVAPQSMSKPPIIIYYGKKPPIHVYQKPDEEYGSQTSGSSTSSVTTFTTSAESPSSESKFVSNDDNNNEAIKSVELTFGGSRNSEVRVAAPPSAAPSGGEQPAIIPAKPVDIFSSSHLQPTIYRARNSLNTILVSDLGSGANTIKTYIVRSNEDLPEQEQNASFFVRNENNGNNEDGSIPIAQNRISGSGAAAQNAPVLEEEQVEQVEESGDDSNNSESNDAPTIVLAIGTPTTQQETGEELQSEPSEPDKAIIQSPSSFQTSLSQAENASAEVSSS